MLGHLTGQVDDGMDDGRGRKRNVIHRSVMALDHLGRELPCGSLGQQPRLGLHPQAQRMLTNQTTGIRVVGRDRGCATQHLGAVLLLYRSPHANVTQPAQAPRDALGELGGRLAGEGQSQDLVGLHVTVGDQPDDPRGHRLGLARAGASHDQQRTHRRLDDGALLGGRRRVAQGEGDRLR